MNIQDILELIGKDANCNLVPKMNTNENKINLPDDLKYFYEKYESLELFSNKSYAIKISSLDELIPTNKKLFPEDDVIWEELEGDISNDWFLIASSEQLSQYISIDLSDRNFGYCYDSFLETHANPEDSAIIAKSFTELLERLYESGGDSWYWLEDFEPYGDAYDDFEI
ncbi:SMI1/KNR4 family protein [Cellulophaga baltica]|uniref:SMI1/KNR4 family protein n=1 Tax=Cellulophaga baltica TaxID=76594 RepID=UPI0037CC405D